MNDRMDDVIKANRKKLDDEDNRSDGNEHDDSNGSSSTAVGNGCEPPMFILNHDCFEHVFRLLSLKDLLNFRRVCKHIKFIVNGYIASKYQRLRYMRIKNFEHTLTSYQMQLDCFDWIRHLCIRNIKLPCCRIESIKTVWNQLESLELIDVKMDDDSFKTLMSYCVRINYLSLITTTSTRIVLGTGFNWLRRQYPTLEHVRIETGARYRIPYMRAFFQRNPSIRIFSTDCKFLSTNHCSIVKLKPKLSRLNLTVDSAFDFVHSLANDLEQQNLYAQLHLRITDGRWWSEEQCENLWKLRNLQKLALSSLPKNAAIPVVASIEKLSIETCENASPDILRTMATNFINLDQVTMHAACLYDIRSFVCHAPKLKQCKVVTFIHNGMVQHSQDFRALNEER